MERRTLSNLLLESTFCMLILCLTPGILAQEIPDPGTNLVDESRLRNLRYEKDQTGIISSVQGNGNDPFTLAVSTLVQPEFIYNLAIRIPLAKQRIRKGQILLLSFIAKTEFSSLETGEARSLWVLNVSDEIKDREKRTISISSDWKRYDIPIEVHQHITPDDLALILQFGFPPQKFLLRDIALYLFDQETDIETLPKTRITYPGMEPDAPWRIKALERIEKIRKTDFTVQMMRNGKPLTNTTIRIDLKQHSFGWGAAVRAEHLLQGDRHLDHFTQAFNMAVFENDLKIKFWNRTGRKDQVLQAIQLLEDHGLDIKGHVLIWPGFNHLPAHFRRHRKNPGKIEKLMRNHVRDILSATRGRIGSWDVVNEAYTNKDLQEITGSEEILYMGFREVEKRDPGAKKYVNEYGIISKGGLDTRKQEWYRDYIRRIDRNTDGLVDGIGIQCHMGSDLTSPEKVLRILDIYAELGKEISISEFTMDVDDRDVRQGYTADFMIAAFSHPAVTSFLFWGYQDERADIYTSDWQPGSMGKAYFQLVRDRWHTQFVGQTGPKGRLTTNGFYGTYTYEFVEGNKLVSGTFEVTPDSGALIFIEVGE